MGTSGHRGPSAWPKDIDLTGARRPKAQGGFLRWLWIKPTHSSGLAQPALYEVVRAPGDPLRIGVCCSGGGLRSAAFSFGAMDTLWRRGVLQNADFLAGVSGGSYAVAAATIVRTQSGPWPDDSPGPYALGSPELDYLRNRTDYLAPGVMGRWNMFLRLLLGILVNLAVVMGLLYVVGRAAGRLYRAVLPALGTCTGRGCDGSLRFHAWSTWVIVGLFGAGLLAGLVDLFFRPGVEWWWRRLVRWCGTFVFLGILAVFVFRLVPLTIWWARTGRYGFLHASDLKVGTRSVATAVGSMAVAMAHLVTRSGSSGGRGSLPKKVAKIPHKLRTAVQKLAVAIAVPLSLVVFLLIAIDAGTRRWTRANTLVWLVVAALVSLVMVSANPIAWSAQPFYKRRLRSVFALHRVTDEHGRVTVAPIRSDQEPPMSALGCEGWPQLLICASAHVADLGLTPPGLGVTSFVFSAERVGGPLVGSVGTTTFEDRIVRERWFQTLYRRATGVSLTGRRRDVSPLSAVSISGAAVAPSMGRMNQPAYRMLIALLNLRLGVWLPNPRRVAALGDGERFEPLVRPTYLWREMFGQNHLDSPFVYVADGGHYENLGLVELLRRGCTTIWAIDASGDTPGTMRSLGQAIALARAELGVEFDGLDADSFALVGDTAPGLCRASHAIVPFTYPGCEKEPGTLIYVKKALVHDDSPADVLAYQKARPLFPNDSTGDQFYDVEQFEAYRALGASVAKRACNAQLGPPNG